MNISIEIIKQLREETGAGVLDCRTALEYAQADYPRALGYLREKGMVAAAKRAERPATQGLIEVYSHGQGRIGVMVEVNTETDFAARSAAVRTLAHELILQIAAAAPVYVRDEDIPAEVLQAEAEKAAQKARAEGRPEAVLPRILAGSLEKFKDQTVLLRQVYIRDETITVAQLLHQTIGSVGENIVIRRFVRWELGDSGLEDETAAK